MARIDLTGDSALVAYQKVCARLGRTLLEAAISANLDPDIIEDALSGITSLTTADSTAIKNAVINFIDKERQRLALMKTQLTAIQP